MSALLHRKEIQTDVVHGSCLLIEYMLQSMVQRKQNVVFKLLEEIVFHTLWIMSELIKRGHHDSSQGDDSYSPEKVVKLVVGWMMTPQIVGFDFFGGRALSRVHTELKANKKALSIHASSTNSVQCNIEFVFNSPVLYNSDWYSLMSSFPQVWKVLFADVQCPDCIADQWKVELVNALKKRVDKVSGEINCYE